MRARDLQVVACVAALLAGVAWLHAPLVACLDGCFVDYEALHGPKLGKLELPDARLNSWILAWVLHAVGSDPLSLFDANAFYPLPNTLSQSEHLLGIAAQLLPVRALTPSAVALHQAAIVLSAALLALATFGCARALARSTWAGLVAGVVAIYMPWRLAELSHVQLLSAQWFPVTWLLAARAAKGGASRVALAGLAAALSLQLLTSFYLAYFLIFSTAVLLAALALQGRVTRAGLVALAKAAAVPASLLGLVALPYLAWQSTRGFAPLEELFHSVRPGDAWRLVGPGLSLELGGALPRRIDYQVPAVVFALGLAAALVRGREGASRAFAVALWTVAGACFVMVLGRELSLGDGAIPLPSDWARRLVPGFERLRNPLRWAIPIGVAFPLLAGLGASALEWALLRDRSGAPRALLRGGVAVAILASLPLSRLPSAPVWEDRAAVERAYGVLRALPDGPVVEIPWPLQPQRDVDVASQYMLASTLHWKPITNGTSGYIPRRYALVRQLAYGLPLPAALERLRQIADVRWIVVHPDKLLPLERVPWEAAGRAGSLRRVYADETLWIYEVPGFGRGAPYLADFVATGPRPRTFAGLPRTPLDLPRPAGSLDARPTGPFLFHGARRVPRMVALTVANWSDRPWPGLDADREGLVLVRYAFARHGATLTDVVPLAVDVPAHSQVTSLVPVTGPAEAGRYRLRLELVQQIAGAARPLPMPPAELEVEVLAGRAEAVKEVRR